MHNNLATGEFAGPLGAKRANTKWQILRDILKEHGPDRTVEQWRQVCFHNRHIHRTQHTAQKNVASLVNGPRSTPQITILVISLHARFHRDGFRRIVAY